MRLLTTAHAHAQAAGCSATTVLPLIPCAFVCAGSAVLVAAVVERAKKCLDFVATMYLGHLCLCTWFDGRLPYAWEWWAANGISMVCVVVVSEFVCLKREMADIPRSDSKA
jgi:hypothetical protein